MSTVIKVENLSKLYRLGQVGTGSLAHDINRWWQNLRGKEDPYLKIGEENDRTTKSVSEYVWALKEINFEVKNGDVLGIIGRNGAGKSTLLKILSRTTSPTTGTVKIKGRVASLLEVGTGFHPELSGKDNVFLNGAILGMTKKEIESKFDEIVDFSGVERYIDTPVKRYSSGMYVRLAFAVAAYLEPDILIVDEVLAVGDAEFQRKALGKMKDVSQNEGRTVLVVSHNMQSIQKLCTKGLLMEKGRITYLGDVYGVLKKYKVENTDELEFVLQSNFDLTANSSKSIEGGMIAVDLFCDNTRNNLMYPGCRLSFETTIDNNKTIDDIVFGFQVNREDGTAIIGLHNKIYGQKISVLPLKKGKVRVTIPSLPLIQSGIYSVDLFLGDGMENFDIVYKAFMFKLDASVAKSFIYPVTESINQVYIQDVSFNLID